MKQLLIDAVLGIFSITFTNNWITYLSDALIFIWTVGNILSEVRDIWALGMKLYCSDWVNRLNILLNFTFLMDMLVKYTFIIKSGGYETPGLRTEQFAHPYDFADSMRSLGFLFLLFKLFKLARMTDLIGRPQYFLGKAITAGFRFYLIVFCTLLAVTVSVNGLIHRSYAEFQQTCAQERPRRRGEGFSTCTLRQIIPSSREEMEDYQNWGKVLMEFLFTMFNPDSRLIRNFPEYITPQEWALVCLYVVYAFFLVVVGLNLLKSLIIFAVLDSLKHEDEMFLFRRTMHYFKFISGHETMPSPFNVLPSIRRISIWLRLKNEPEAQLFTEKQLNDVVKLRQIILRLKNSYLREHKKSSRKGHVTPDNLEAFKNSVNAKCLKLVYNVSGLQKKAEELVELNTRKKKIANKTTNENGELEEIVESNPFLLRYKNRMYNFLKPTGLSAFIKKK